MPKSCKPCCVHCSHAGSQSNPQQPAASWYLIEAVLIPTAMHKATQHWAAKQFRLLLVSALKCSQKDHTTCQLAVVHFAWVASPCQLLGCCMASGPSECYAARTGKLSKQTNQNTPQSPDTLYPCCCNDHPWCCSMPYAS